MGGPRFDLHVNCAYQKKKEMIYEEQKIINEPGTEDY